MPNNNSKPGYINFLRLFATLNAILGIFAILVFVFQLTQFSKFGWVYIMISLGLTLEGFLAYGLLNAVADIAENMIDVGNYVRNLNSEKK